MRCYTLYSMLLRKKGGWFILFIIVFVFQYFFWNTLSFYDDTMWAKQAQDVLTANPERFNPATAYGHPGGPIIEGVIILQKITNLSYLQTLYLFLALAGSMCIVITSYFCHKLTQGYTWPVSTVLILTINSIYPYGTPPSILASLLVVFLAIYTLYLSRKTISNKLIIFWSILSGILIATRFDIGTIMTCCFWVLLVPRVTKKQILLTICIPLITFIICDPFMWSMPIKHIQDILSKVLYHYNEFTPTHLSFISVVSISGLTFTSMLIGLYMVLFKRKDFALFSKKFLLLLLFITVTLFYIFLNSHYQTQRYFMPLLLLWEVFLPFFIYSLIQKNTHINSKLKDFLTIVLPGTIVLYHAILLIMFYTVK